jgi:hypothetical protein
MNVPNVSGHFQSLALVLRGVAYPVEPLGFMSVSNDLPPSLFDGIRESLREETNLLDPLDDRYANEL